MKIAVIGGGPAGLYFSILMMQTRPGTQITVYERNRHDDTFGWGVVFSDETLGNIEAADPPSFAKIRASFIYWQNIETYYQDQCIVSTGHGFCGLSRKRLLLILQDRCRELGVDLKFETEVNDLGALDADVIIAADGVNSRYRELFAADYEPSLDWRKCKFAWFGTNKQLEAFTFIFLETEHGLFQVHAYPFEQGKSTWIVECREEVWRRAGLDRMDEQESARYSEELFRPWLGDHDLLVNRSLWRTFPTVKCRRWRHDNVLLVGDSAHTAHFSIGSGTKLAMEDTIALAGAFEAHGDDLDAVFGAYEDARYVDVLKTQKAAQTSLEWFENSGRYMRQDLLFFTFNLMCRSKQITFDNLELRDPELVARVVERYGEAAGAARQADGTFPAPMFTPFKLRGLELSGRVVVSPMCQYSATDGVPNDWHLVHLGSRAIGGAALVMTEMTNVTRDGRITPGCAGLWSDAQGEAWARIVDFVHENSTAKIGIQLAHAGRKGSCAHPWDGDDTPLIGDEAWPTLAPSALPFRKDWHVPKAMDRADMELVRDAFVQSARRAERAGFDLIELHMAHGYLLSSFISPLSNRRDDDYGGSLENRMRFPLEVFDAVRTVWPARKPMSVRISATDWLDDDGGLTATDSVEVARMLKQHGCDIVDVSSAGNVPESEPIYGRMYQVPFAEQIRYEVGIPVMAVGAILGPDHCNTILAAGRADLCALARPHLRDAYLTLHAAEHYGYDAQPWPGQYLPGKPRPAPESNR